MFQTPTTTVWHKLYEQGKLDPIQGKFWNTKPPEELYELTSDSDQVHNLVNAPEHSQALNRMRSAHHDWAMRIRDVGFLTEWEMHERSKDITPYEMGHDPSRFDFDKLFAAADLATSLNPSDLPAIVRLLEHDDSGVRYWAALGLLAHGDVAARVARAELQAALEDDSPMVRITAAESLGRYGTEHEAAAALAVLLKYARPEENAYLNLAAWNALDYLDDRAKPAVNEIEAIQTLPRNAPPRWGDYTSLVKQKVLADLQ
jgi:uncharacterized sulfatase